MRPSRYASSWLVSSAVIGIGINLTQDGDDLPIPAATSMRLEGSSAARDDLLIDILTVLHGELAELRRDGIAFVMDRYRSLCLTVGRDVAVILPSGETIQGRAVGVGEDGQLHVRTAEKTVSVAAGDVIHATI